ncbi:MAG: hypothetical protein J0M08_10955 [Bacteroidetes bacterium]|nr:hypothetical protein [Bacteroidota bacterium]
MFAQPACVVSPTSFCNPVGGGSVYLMSTSSNVDLTFDSFGKFVGGITQSGGTVLKLAITEAAAPCRWQLHANVDNGGGLTPVTEWELITPYGAAGPPHPTVDLLDMRIRNQCNTSLSGTSFVDIPNINQTIDIVENPGADVLPGAGTCALNQNVNTEGTYLTDYGQYAFTVDYRVLPTLTLRPGIYQLTVRYCLTEDN